MGRRAYQRVGTDGLKKTTPVQNGRWLFPEEIFGDVGQGNNCYRTNFNGQGQKHLMHLQNSQMPLRNPAIPLKETNYTTRATLLEKEILKET